MTFNLIFGFNDNFEKRKVEYDIESSFQIKQNIGIAYPNRSKLRGITAMQIDRVLTDAY